MRTAIVIGLSFFTVAGVACGAAHSNAVNDGASSDGGSGADGGAATGDGGEPSEGGAGGGNDSGSSSGDGGGSGAMWKPTQADRFLYQLGDTVPATTACSVPQSGGACVKPTVWAFDLYTADGMTPNAAGAAAVHSVNGHAVCYVSGGSLENYRPDASQFPAGVLGKTLVGWPDEKWLDVRQLTVLEPLMRARAKKCRTAGFDAIDWDNVDGYTNDNGFGFTAGDQLAYNELLAKIAHDEGLSVGLKNDLDQIPDLVGSFDFGVNEQCAEYTECASLDPFTKAGKAVAQIEYNTDPTAFCTDAVSAGRSASKMALDLKTTPWSPCR